MAVNSNLTKILFKYSGYVSTPTLGATWKGKDFVIAMRFRLVQLIAVVFLFLDSTFFLVEMEKYENPSRKIIIFLVELIVSIVIFFWIRSMVSKKALNVSSPPGNRTQFL